MTRNAIAWHPADIQAAIAKKGASMSDIARAHNLDRTTIYKALQTPCYAGEQAIAAFLDLPAQEIWPSRYDAEGLPKHPRIRRQLNVIMTTKEGQKGAAA